MTWPWHRTQLIAKTRGPKRAVAHVNKVKGTQCKHPVKEQLRMGPDKLLEFFNKREATITPRSSMPTTRV